MKRAAIFVSILITGIALACTLPAGPNVQPPAIPTIPQVAVTSNIPIPTASGTSLPPAAQTFTPTVTITQTVSPTPSVPTALFIMNANCRSGPDKTKTAVMSFLKGETSEILGRNNELDNTWWQVKIPNSDDKCWVSTITVNVIGSYDDIPTIPPPY
ncbi:MAG: SH3 domain-containing protein [Chloroflexi bacterium]|nr:SH3 domain-containing protein [Chloroflexota bacterium]